MSLASQEMEEGGSQSYGLLRLQNDFKINLGILVRPCFKIKGKRDRRVRLGDSLRGAKQFQAIYFLMESSST